MRSLPSLESCLLWIRNTIRESRRRKTMLWSSYTRTLLRCFRCFSILLSRLSGNPMTMSLLTHCFLSAKTPPSIFFRCCSNFVAELSCSLVVIFLRRPQVYWDFILPALASLLRLNPSRLWLLPGSTIRLALSSMRYDPTLLAAVAEAAARTVVVVRREVQAVTTLSFGISNLLGSWLLRRPLR